MAKAAARRSTPAKPAQRAAQSTGNKAQQAAQAQGRAAPPPREQTRAAPPQEQRRPQTPAIRQPSRQDIANYGNTDQLPDYMRKYADQGKEAIGRDDVETPRLKLMQGTSKELNAYDDLRPGDFFHTAGEVIFKAAEPFRTVLLYLDRRYILWRPLEDGGGILARADDGVHWSPAQGSFDVTLDRKDGGAKVNWKVAPTVQQSGLANWGTMDPNNPNSPPAATLMYNFVLAFPDMPDLMPAVFTFQRSAVKRAKRLNAKIKSSRGPLFGNYWQFSSELDHNSSGQEFHNVSVISDGFVEESEIAMYAAMHESFKNIGLQVKDLADLQGEDEEVPGGDANDNQVDSNAPRY